MNRNDLSRLVHRMFSRCGLEVRLVKNIREAKRHERQEALLKPWQLLSNFNIQTIIDIGANEGQFAAMAREICPKAHIYSFEPLPDVYEQLCANHVSNPHVTPINLGLSDRSSQVQMFRSAFSPSSSLLPMAELHRTEWPQSVEQSAVDVKVVRLDDWIRDEGIDLNPDCLVKIDVQGHELGVIRGGLETLKQAKLIVAEVSFYELYQKQPLFDAIYRAIYDLGFIYRGNLEQYSSQKENKNLFADALFERLA